MNQIVLKGKIIQSVFVDNDKSIYHMEIILEVKNKALLCIIKDKSLGEFYSHNFRISNCICVYGHLDAEFKTINRKTVYEMSVIVDKLCIAESPKM